MQSTFRYDVFRGVATDAYAGTGILSFLWVGVVGVTRIFEAKVWDANAEIIMTFDGLIWGPAIELDIDDPPWQIPHACREVQIRNNTAGANSRYQICGFW